MDTLNVPFNSKDRKERAKELKQASDCSKNTKFGRELIDAVYEIYDESDVDDPFESIRKRSKSWDGLDYDPKEQLERNLTIDEIQEILSQTEPELYIIHLPDNIGGQLNNLKQRINICMAIARYRYDYLSRDNAESIVEDVIGEGSNKYYVHPAKADVPGKMLDRCYEEPSLSFIDTDKARWTSAESYYDKYNLLCSGIITRSSTGDGSLLDMDKSERKGCISKCNELIKHGERMIIALEDGEKVEQVKRNVNDIQSVGKEIMETVEED